MLNAESVVWREGGTATCAAELVSYFLELGGKPSPELTNALHAWFLPAFARYINAQLPESVREEAVKRTAFHLHDSCRLEGSGSEYCGEDNARKRAEVLLEKHVSDYAARVGDVTAVAYTSGVDGEMEIVPVTDVSVAKMLLLQIGYEAHSGWDPEDVAYWELTHKANDADCLSLYMETAEGGAICLVELRPLTKRLEAFLRTAIEDHDLGYPLSSGLRWLHEYGPEAHDAVKAAYAAKGNISFFNAKAVREFIEIYQKLPTERAEVFAALALTWQGELEELAKHTLSISA